MDDHATGRAQAWCKAGPSSNLGSAPQVPGRFPQWANNDEENWDVENPILNNK